MRAASRAWVLFAGLSVLGACQRFAPDEALVSEARGVLDAVIRRDFGAVVGRFDESLRSPDPTEALKLVADAFPATPPTRVHLVGSNINTVQAAGGAKTETAQITFEFNYADTNVISGVAFRRIDDGDRKIVGVRAQRLETRLEVMNGFTFANKGPLHYGFIIVMIVVAGVTLAALASWRRRRRSLRHPWRWLLAILVGAFKITMNWTTGAVGVQALTVQLLSLGYVRLGEGAPWFLSFSIPAGAIAFLVLEWRGQLTSNEPPEPPPGPPPVG